ncbi:MAG: hypothetical protein ACE5R6_15995 [Candidatus Heimdallarchaeota archaeon]
MELEVKIKKIRDKLIRGSQRKAVKTLLNELTFERRSLPQDIFTTEEGNLLVLIIALQEQISELEERIITLEERVETLQEQLDERSGR